MFLVRGEPTDCNECSSILRWTAATHTCNVSVFVWVLLIIMFQYLRLLVSVMFLHSCSVGVQISRYNKKRLMISASMLSCYSALSSRILITNHLVTFLTLHSRSPVLQPINTYYSLIGAVYVFRVCA